LSIYLKTSRDQDDEDGGRRDKDYCYVHCACDHGAPLQVIQMLLDSDTRQETILEGDYGYLPLHYACWKNAPFEVIQLLLDSDDRSLRKAMMEECPSIWRVMRMYLWR
jgi:hypothetical protein